MPQSSLERYFETHILEATPELLPCYAEYQFAKKALKRDWRFDFAWPDHKIAVEIEGGIWTNGGHSRGTGFNEDCDKYNAAALLGWRVIRFTVNHLRDNPAHIIELLKGVLHGHGSTIQFPTYERRGGKAKNRPDQKTPRQRKTRAAGGLPKGRT